jgi:hypothetical protein
MKSKITEINGQEVLCRFEEIRDGDGVFTVYKTTPIITKDEFLCAYNAWIKEGES